MSYILDALRKADAERERGRVPGIHAQPLGAHATDDDPPSRSRSLLWLTIGLLLAVVVALTWHVARREATPPGAESRAAASAASAVAAAPAGAALPAAALPASAATPGKAAAASHAAAAVSTAASATLAAAHPTKPPVDTHGSKARRAARKAAPPPTDTATAKTTPAKAAKIETATIAAATTAVAPATTKTPAAAKPVAPDARVYTLGELPPEIRQQLPALAVGGASYSSNPASRMLIVNGQVFHERDRLTPDLVLQQIKLKTAVLEYKGYRYEIKY